MPLSSPAAGSITVEVIYATADEQILHRVKLPVGSTVSDALTAAYGHSHSPGRSGTDKLAVGVWGKVVDRAFKLGDGDRVEIYRPLIRDPREARRALAAEGKVMSEPRRGA